MEKSFARDYFPRVWSKWWWLVMSGVILAIFGAIGTVWKQIRVPAVIALVIGLLAVIVAQVMVAHGIWKERNQARQDTAKAVAERDQAIREAKTGVDVTLIKGNLINSSFEHNQVQVAVGTAIPPPHGAVFIADLVRTLDPPIIRELVIEGRDVFGPAMLILQDGAVLTRNRWDQPMEIAVIGVHEQQEEVTGVVVLAMNGGFRNCRMHNVGVLAPPAIRNAILARQGPPPEGWD